MKKNKKKTLNLYYCVYFCGKTIHPAIRNFQKEEERIIIIRRRKNIIHYKTKEWNRIIGNDWFNTKHNDFRINCFLGVSNKSGFFFVYYIRFFFESVFVVSVCCCGMSTPSLTHSLTYSLCCRNQKNEKETSNLFVHIFFNNELCLYSFNYFWMRSILWKQLWEW